LNLASASVLVLIALASAFSSNAEMTAEQFSVLASSILTMPPGEISGERNARRMEMVALSPFARSLTVIVLE
jgi:hypothetical protein